ncbi:MAG: ribosome biogenesis GTPase Der [Lentisphaerae bacterium]|nr:ribosome biogenesis GTPase Der [Lentisphaerota bacterium]
MNASESDAMPTPADSKQRVIAIVGRPNVGKSAIFNRLASRRIAIVHAQPGVTRDRLVYDAHWGAEKVQLVDTGGVSNVDRATSTDVIEAGVRRQVEAALADAAVALLVVDIEAGLHPLDSAVATWLRKSGCQTLVLANKADTAARDLDATEFDRLGFPVFPVAALHNRGFDAVKEAVIKACPPASPGADANVAEPLRVAIVGRPNVGKSSFINRLLGDERVIVSSVPGTTRDSIDIPFQVGTGPTARRYLLVDTAGMRRSGKIDTVVERFSRMRTEDSLARANVAVLLLDAAVGPTAQDKTIAAMVMKYQRGAVVLVNKWDLAEATQRRYDPALREEMPFLSHCPILYVSAHSGFNIRRSLEVIDAVAAQVQTRLPTGILNRAILDAYERVQAPAISGKRLKLYYVTQVGCDPIRIRLFINVEGGAVPPAYRDYLERSLREKFGLEGAPIVLQFVARRREPREGTADVPRRRPLIRSNANKKPPRGGPKRKP